MPEHFHILITAKSGTDVMQFLRGFRRSVSGKVRWLIEGGESGFEGILNKYGINPCSFYFKTAGKSEFRFWKETPRVFPMNFWPDIQEKLNYIHYNPVRRGLVAVPEDWPHSSVRSHFFDEETRIKVGILPQDVASHPS
jgi:REP element-mobilizing transposase RayT